MSKTQEQFNAEYSQLATRLGDAIVREEQAQLDQKSVKAQIASLKQELAAAVEADQKAKAAAAKDIPLEKPVGMESERSS